MGSMGDKTDRFSGEMKEKAGKASADPDLARKGRDEQARADLKASARKA
jgi:uncharacterized protein YjbJ (UPF0337 family)